LYFDWFILLLTAAAGSSRSAATWGDFELSETVGDTSEIK
jgi:hypothetical protein